MGYEHGLHAEVDFKPGVTLDAALSALEPLSEYRNWTQEAILANKLPRDDTVVITIAAGFIQHLSIYSNGQVSYSFADLVDTFATNLNAIAEPGCMELHDYDTADLHNAISYIWYGDPDEVAQARRTNAWKKSAELLRSVNIPQTMLDAMASIGGFDADSPPLATTTSTATTGNIGAAQLFWQELLASVEALTAIADQHGPRTLADLFYLQNAILNCGFIDHYPGESNVLDLARALPSGERWAIYIKIEYLDSPIHP
jgi:hypothetical protein